MLVRVCSCIVLVSLAVTGCTAPQPARVVTDPDPGVKIPAIKDAVHDKDLAATKQLVADLDNDDPAVRFYAINGLQRLTGETFGYRYYDDEPARDAAVMRWRAWMDGKKPH